MRVLMISDGRTARMDGRPISLELLRRRLASAGHQVTLLVPGGVEPGSNSDVVRIPYRYLFLDPGDRGADAAPVRALTERLRAAHYEIVHLHTPFLGFAFGIRLAQALGVPVMETYVASTACQVPPEPCHESDTLPR